VENNISALRFLYKKTLKGRDLAFDDLPFPSNYSAATDAEGYFKIEDVKPGRYSIVLERSGFVETDKRGGRKKSLVLEPGREIKDLVLRMDAAAVVTGKILDSDGDPMPNVAVSISRYGSTSSRRNLQANGYGSTNDLGEYRIGTNQWVWQSRTGTALALLRSRTTDHLK
jgi:hypothetical protein